jgi:hypothetical protein
VLEVVNKRGGELFNDNDQILLTLLCRFAGEFLHIMIQQDALEESAEAKEAKAPPQTPQTS